MKKVRLFTVLILTGAVLSGVSQCNSQKKILVENPPFTLGDVAAEAWSSPDGASGTNLYIPVTEGKTILLDSVYFRDKVTQPEKIQRDSYLVYIGRFNDSAPEDMILHENPKKEFGNTPPERHKKLAFDLNDDEAVVRFTENKKVKYYKIENIREAVPVER